MSVVNIDLYETNNDHLNDTKTMMKSRFSDFVETYITSSDQYMSMVEKSANDGDLKMLVKSVHPLKSSGRHMGMVGLYNIAAHIEETGETILEGGEGSIDDLVDLIPKLSEAYHFSKTYLKQHTA